MGKLSPPVGSDCIMISPKKHVQLVSIMEILSTYLPMLHSEHEGEVVLWKVADPVSGCTWSLGHSRYLVMKLEHAIQLV